jgi:hypothetical protein
MTLIEPEFYTIERLKEVFKVSDERTIKACFGSKNVLIRNEVEIISSGIIKDHFGFLPEEPFLTAAEVIQELGIDENRLVVLVRGHMLPVFKLANAKGSCRLFLKKDITQLKQTVIIYNNSPAIYMRSAGLVRTIMSNLAWLDFKNRRRFFRKERNIEIFDRYFIKMETPETIAAALEISTSHVWITIQKSIHQINHIANDVSELYNNYQRVLNENAKLNDRINSMEPVVQQYAKKDKGPLLSELSPRDLQTVNEAMTKLEQVVSRKGNGLSTRTYNALLRFFSEQKPHRERCWKILAETPVSKIGETKNLGQRGLEEICNYMMNEIKIYPNLSPVHRIIIPNNIIEFIIKK